VIEIRLKLARATGYTLDVALSLPERGVSALVGPSGCGKTTVLRALAGLERTQGRVALGPTVWQDDDLGLFVPTHKRAIGYVIQEAALFPHLTVSGNIEYGRKRSGVDPAVARTDAVIDLLGLRALLTRRPEGLSGGERQRVAIARALATSPRLLLLDEPLAALDAARKSEILPYLERLAAELAMPIVFVSHAMDEVIRLADHLVLLRDGRVRAAGPMAETLARLDLPLGLGEEAGVVLQTRVGERDLQWHLARLDLPAAHCHLWARDQGHATGTAVRVRVLARDVSLTRAPQADSSIGNQVPGVVEALADDEHPALALVRVRLGSGTGTGTGSGRSAAPSGEPLLARVTRRSAQALNLVPGVAVWVQVKTVALME